MSDHRAHVPAAVSTYYRAFGWPFSHPIIRQEFRPGRGWVTPSYHKRVTVSWARKLRREGVTHVALDAGTGRLADFSLTEIIRGGVAPLHSSSPPHPRSIA